MLRALRLVAGVLTLALALAAPAVAADDFEPNDTVATAYGPLNAEEYFEGETTTSEDQDWFWFDTDGAGTVTVTLEGNAGCTSASLQLTDVTKGTAATTFTGSLESVPLSASLDAAGRSQYAVRVTGSAGCVYALTADPAGVVTVRPPGITAFLGHTGDLDAIQRVLVDGKVIGEATNDQEAWVDLGAIAPDARVTFEAQNAATSWAWHVRLTNTTGDVRTVIFQEHELEGRAAYRTAVRNHLPDRMGIVRRVVLDPAGTILESCGERNAPALCFPLDRDLDGVPDGTDQCATEPAPGTATGCPDRDGDGLTDRIDQCPDAAGLIAGCPDGDGDQVPDRADQCPTFAGKAPTGCPYLQRYESIVSLRHRGRRFTGRLVNLGPGCLAGRTVTLKAVGRSKKTLGSAKTTKKGTFSIVLRKKPRRGPYKVSVAEVQLSPATLCRAGSSRVVG